MTSVECKAAVDVAIFQPRTIIMSQKILIVGAGFAGVRGALRAARVLDGAGVTSSDVEITLISPRPELQIRPRRYESEPSVDGCTAAAAARCS